MLNRILRHNLRNKLAIVLGRAQLLAEPDSPEVATHVEPILSSARELHEATSYTKDPTDILDSQQVPQRSHDVTKHITETVNDLSDAHPDAEFVLDLVSDQHVTAAPKLAIALEHILQNAVEHNDSDVPLVEVTVDPPNSEGENVEILIEDNGPGIPKMERDVLVDGKETPLHHGSGLGLWIVNWIITRSGGHISFKTYPGGSCVILALPPANPSLDRQPRTE